MTMYTPTVDVTRSFNEDFTRKSMTSSPYGDSKIEGLAHLMNAHRPIDYPKVQFTRDLKDLQPSSLGEIAISPGTGGGNFFPEGGIVPSSQIYNRVDGVAKITFSLSAEFLLLLAAATPGLSTVVFASLAISHAVRAHTGRDEDELCREAHSIKSVVYGIFAVPVVGNCVAAVEVCKRVAAFFGKRIFS